MAMTNLPDHVLRARIKEAHDREWERCAKDFWYWATNYVKTDDEERQELRQFPEYEYLKTAKALIDANQKTIILKPRRMLVSWLGMVDQLHSAFFAGSGVDGVPPIFYGGVMSIGETEANYLMGRLVTVMSHMPDWMLARNPIVKDNEMLKVWSNGGKIQAFPMKRIGPQTFGFSKVFFDEMAWQEAVRSTWKGLIPTLGAHGKLLAVSTPNGRLNLFHEVWSNLEGKYSDFARYEPNWWDDPEHDENWWKHATSGLTQHEINQMYLKSFAVPEGKPVYPDFNRMVNVTETQVGRSTMYIGWDLGYHFPAVSFWQRNTRDQWVGHRCIQGFDESFADFCARAIEMASSFYDRRNTPEIHCVPPDSRQAYRTRSRTGAINDFEEIKLQWKLYGHEPQIYVAFGDRQTRTIESPRLKETRTLWKLRKDGEPGAIVHPSMDFFIEGCEGGYCYRTGVDTEEPAKNEYSHLQESFQHIVVCYNHIHAARSGQAQEQAKQQIRRRIGHRTGL